MEIKKIKNDKKRESLLLKDLDYRDKTYLKLALNIAVLQSSLSQQTNFLKMMNTEKKTTEFDYYDDFKKWCLAVSDSF
ncbi:hypothetical protein [Enterococcus sp.]|uniref:hypothetical protein n=1 Tax=Enterococcus sp. TaxID=35783 RepID=UPI0028AAE192|nr:hypothetical protein [Enterococcus sp.]